MKSFLHRIPSRQVKPAKIVAKGPQDCVPLTPEQFVGATVYVAKAFLSAALLPKDFFAGVPVTSAFSKDAEQRTLLAAYAHFKQNGVLSLSFYCRYKALLRLSTTADVSPWVTQNGESEYAVFSADILSLAARHPLLPSGHFDNESFLAQLNAIKRAAVLEATPTAPLTDEVVAEQMTA